MHKLVVCDVLNQSLFCCGYHAFSYRVQHTWKTVYEWLLLFYSLNMAKQPYRKLLLCSVYLAFHAQGAI